MLRVWGDQSHGLEMYDESKVCAFEEDAKINIARLIKYSNTALNLLEVRQLLP